MDFDFEAGSKSMYNVNAYILFKKYFFLLQLTGNENLIKIL